MPELAAGEALADSVREVLETMFFAGVYAEIPGAATSGHIHARLPFAGGRRGEFRMSVSQEAARTIAAGFLGLEETELTVAQIGDVVCEMTNVICGSVLSHVGADLAYDLHPPRLMADGEAANACQCPARTFDLGNGTLSVGIRFDPS